jgi:hypothetical protein
MNSLPKRLLSTVLLIGCNRIADGQTAEEAVAVMRIRNFFTDKRAKQVLTWAYPFATYQGIACPEGQRLSDSGFIYHCYIAWKAAIVGEDRTYIGFVFGADGAFKRTALEERSFAFTLTTAVLQQLTEVALKELQDRLTPEQVERIRMSVRKGSAQNVMDIFPSMQQ